MGVFDSIKRSLNISGSGIQIDTDRESYGQGEMVSGTVSVRGGEYEQPYNSLDVKLVEFWTEYRGSGKHRHKVTVTSDHRTVHLADAAILSVGAAKSYHFEADLLRNCRLSTRETGWYLLAELDVPGALNPKEKKVLGVGPAEELLVIVAGCMEGPRFREDVSKRLWDQTSWRTRLRLLPPEDMKTFFDGVDLEVEVRGDGSVEGEAIVNLQEHSVKDYLKALVRQDRIHIPFGLVRSQIYLEDGRGNSAAIAEVFGRVLDQAMQNETHKD